MPKSAREIKKVLKSLEVSKILLTFAGDMEEKFYITGINRLTGSREPISRKMSGAEAEQRLEMELRVRRSSRRYPFTKLQIERVQPVQLTINFED